MLVEQFLERWCGVAMWWSGVESFGLTEQGDPAATMPSRAAASVRFTAWIVRSVSRRASRDGVMSTAPMFTRPYRPVPAERIDPTSRVRETAARG